MEDIFEIKRDNDGISVPYVRQGKLIQGSCLTGIYVAHCDEAELAGLPPAIVVKYLDQGTPHSVDLLKVAMEIRKGLYGTVADSLLPRYISFNEREGIVASTYFKGVDLHQEIAALAKCDRNVSSIIAYCRDNVLELSSILDEINSRGVLHCDVKPDNVICRREEEGRSLAMIDIDYMCMMDKESLDSDYVFGTSKYASLDVACGLNGSRERDVYALGILGLEMLEELLRINILPDVPANCNYLAQVLGYGNMSDHMKKFISVIRNKVGDNWPEIYGLVLFLVKAIIADSSKHLVANGPLCKQIINSTPNLTQI